MGEAVREAVPCRWADHRDLVAHRLDHLHRVAAQRAQMQQQVEQREFHLADDEHAGQEPARRHQRVEHPVWQRRTGLVMARHAAQHVAVPGEILHQLARQLDRIPFEPVGAGNAGTIDAREQMVQAMPGLVQEGDHFPVGEQRRACLGFRCEVADEIGNRHLSAVAILQPRTRLRHPRAAALAAAGVQVDIDTGDDRAILVRHVVIAGVGMIDGHVGARDHADAEQAIEQLLPAGNDAFDGKISAHRLLVDRIARGAQPIRDIGQIPGLKRRDPQMVGGVPRQLGIFAGRGRLRPAAEIAEKSQYRAGVGCHLGGQRPRDRIGEAEQPRTLAPQFQDRRDPARIIELPRMRSLIRSARAKRGIHPLAQAAVLGERQDGVHARHLERHDPSGQPARGGRVGEHRRVGLRNAGQHGRILDMLEPGVGRIEHGVAECGRQVRQFDRDRRKARALRCLQRDACQGEIADPMLDGGAIRVCQRREFRCCGERDQHCIHRLVLHHLEAVFDQSFLPGHESGAQFGRVGDSVQVRNRRPDRRDSSVRTLERQPCLGKAARLRRNDAFNHRAMVGNDLVERGRNVLRPDIAETRQVQRVEQRVRHRFIHFRFQTINAVSTPSAAIARALFSARRGSTASCAGGHQSSIGVFRPDDHLRAHRRKPCRHSRTCALADRCYRASSSSDCNAVHGRHGSALSSARHSAGRTRP